MLLTHAELSMLPIDQQALARVPEAIARGLSVFPISQGDGTLHLLLPSGAQHEIDDLIKRLHFALQEPFTYALAVANDLQQTVDLHYSAVGSEIENCSSALKYRCPNDWIDLSPTDNLWIRRCDVCQEDVTFCATSEEMKKLAALNKCVAFLDPEIGLTLGMPFFE